MMPETYWALGEGESKANFYDQLKHHDVIATAIANELTESEIEEAFNWGKRANGNADAEMRAHPLVPYLNPEQTQRFRHELEAII